MARREPSPMLKVERSPSHSWWWDSHNSPKHSKWLHSNLQELDEKVKLTLKLIEEDADSFAQRAEMYYQKRPELVNLVEEFYRAYRSLAERYDHLTGEIRQNIPRALQVQFGLSCDSPKSMGPGSYSGRYHYSPLRRSNQMFERLLKRACELEDLKRDRSNADERRDEVHGNGTNDLCVENLGVDDPCIASHHNSSDGGCSLSSSDSEVDNMTPLERLRQEIDELKETNNVLQKKIKHLEDENHGKQNDADALGCRVKELASELLLLKQQEFPIGVGVVSPEKEPQVECIPFKEERHGFSSGEEDYAGELEEDSCGSAGRFLNNSMKSMQDQLDWLMEENRMQKLAILERAEEKREAIRQLCFSMDLLESKNQRLEEILGVLKKRLHVASVAAAGRPSSAWKHLFSFGDWRVFKATQPFTPIAL